MTFDPPRIDDPRWTTPSDLYDRVPEPTRSWVTGLNVQFLADHLRSLGFTVIPPWPINPYDNFATLEEM